MTICKKSFSATVAVAFALAISDLPVQAIELGVFGDTSMVVNNDSKDNNHFGIGGLDLYANQQISDKVSAFFEIVFENDGDAFVVDVERYQINYQFSPAFRLGAGRFHAPLGYWNRHFHHGVLIQDTPDRPAFLDFEDGEAAILPMHAIGMMAMGKFNDGFEYALSLSNTNSYDTGGSNTGITSNRAGFGSDEIRLGNVSDGTDAKSIVGRLSYSFASVPLELGVFGMNNKLTEDSLMGSAGVKQGKDLVTTRVYGADLHYERNAFDALAEYYYLDNHDETNGVAGDDGTGTAYYVQLGYRLNDYWKLVYRFEKLAVDHNTAYFNILGSQEYNANVAAIRFDVDDSNAITLEVNSKRFHASNDGTTDNGSGTTEYVLNWAFLMF